MRVQKIANYRRAYHILLTEEDPLSRAQLELLLHHPGYLVNAVDTLDAAEALLKTEPVDLVICGAGRESDAAIRFLRQVRVERGHVATLIVASDPERVASLEAWRHGLTALSHPINAEHFQAVVDEKLRGISRRQRWPRKQVNREVPLRVGHSLARLLDVSYGGLRFELTAGDAPLPSQVPIEIDRGIRVDAALVWSAAVSEGYSYLFGAAVVTEPADEWRRFVDRVA